MKPLTTWGETPAALPGEPLSGSTTDSHIFLKAKFLLCAGFGLFMFLCPLGGDGFNTPLSLLTDAIDKFISTNLPWFLTALVVLSAVSGLLGQFVQPAWLRRRAWLAELVCISKPYLVTRLVAMAVTLGVTFGVGPEAVIGEDAGGNMVSLAGTLIAIAFALSFVMPFLTDSGIMEFAGILLKPLTRPLFHVPGRASVDLVASWLASSNTAVLITQQEYEAGCYSRREAAAIMTNFSLVSIPFCMVVAETLGISSHFLALYGVVTAIGLLLAIVGVRMPPLSSIPEAYRGKKNIAEDVPENVSLFGWAVQSALDHAATFQPKQVLDGGAKMTVGILCDLIPIVIAWGTVGSLLVNETPVFQYLSYPMGVYMSLLGVPDAFTAAPATLVGFIDMFIPALISTNLPSEFTRFVIGGLSLVQIIYLTEVGSIIVKADVGIDMKRLFIIFLERTVLALPLLVLAAHFILE